MKKSIRRLPQLQPPWKRPKGPFQSQQEARTTYWDSFSKLWFTRRALKESNLRNRRTASPLRTGSIPAKRQACYDGALGARAVQNFPSFGQEPIYDDNAYTITSTYLDRTLKIYTIHSTQASNAGDFPEYHMTQLNTSATAGNAERFREGVSAFRNARDWTKTQRDEFIVAANGRAIVMPSETSTLEPSTRSISQSTIGPFAIEFETSAHFPRRGSRLQSFQQVSEKRTRKAFLQP